MIKGVFKMLEKIPTYLKIIFGSALMGFVLEVFFVPVRITVGGVSGIATVIHYICGLPVGLLIVLMNIPIFILGLYKFGYKFIIGSFIGMGVMSLSADLSAYLPVRMDDIILSSVFGSGLYGVGMGIVLEAGASTGGTDIIAKYIFRRAGGGSLGSVILCIDAFVIAAAGFVFKSFNVVLYSVISLYVSTYVIDIIVEGFNVSKTAIIVSEKSDEIVSAIFSHLARGVTQLSAVSAYTGRDKRVLLCVIGRHQVNKLKFLIKSVDPEAFVVLMSAREVLGNGFKKITEGE